LHLIEAEQIIRPDLIEILSKFNEMGGVADFILFRVHNAESNKESHLLTAQHTLERLAEDNDIYFNKLARASNTSRDDYFKVTSRPLTTDDGQRITLEEFFGPYFSVKDHRPILLGKTGKPFQNVRVFNEYFYYNEAEEPANVISVKRNEKSEYSTQGYADAFLSPPHSFGLKEMTNFEIGSFFLEFNRLFFDDVNRLTIYAWPTSCSNYFDAGQEWWGSFFWTVYNPLQDWYIGITASTTD
jgi:hypothetical protein